MKNLEDGVNDELISLQEEIYQTFEYWKTDILNRDFYENYIFIILGESYPEQQNFYNGYWEGLKKGWQNTKI